jgi:CelD/BcsL family acetyltransferase involved in cellulose biosynthesis
MIRFFLIHDFEQGGYPVKLTVYDELGLFEHLKSEWNDLLERSAANRVFSTWEWQSIWWTAYQPGKLWVIECRSDEGQLLGLAPWFIENHPDYGRVVRSIGCVEVTDYLDLIIDRRYVSDVLECMASYVREHHDQFDVIDLCNLPESSPGHTLFPAVLSKRGFDVKVSVQEVCPVIQLPDTWEAYLEMLDKKQRHEVRRKIRRAEGAPEEIDWYIVDSSRNLEDEIDRFLRLMAASHAQKASFLEDTQNVDFFRAIVPVAYDKGWLQLSFLTIGGEAAAAYLNFDYGGSVLVYNSGLLPDQYGHLSPGIVLLAYNIQHAIETGHSVFDFLRGNEIYKYRMGGQDTHVYMLRAQLVNAGIPA